MAPPRSSFAAPGTTRHPDIPSLGDPPSLESGAGLRTEPPSTARQLKAMLVRIGILKWREPVATSLEVLLPVAFTLLLMAAWFASKTEEFPAKTYFPFPANETAAPIRPMAVFRSQLCWRTDAIKASVAVNASQTVADLFATCSATQRAAATFKCFDHPKVPVVGLCSPLPGNALLAVSGAFNFTTARYLLTIDELALTSWIAYTAVEDNLRAFFLRFNLPNILMCLNNGGGKIHFAPAASPYVSAFRQYLRTQSVLFAPFLEGQTFATYPEASAYTRDNVEQWAVLELSGNWTKDGLNANIHLNRTGISWTNNVRDRFVAGLGRQETKFYLVSGFATFQQLLHEFYFAYDLRPRLTGVPFAFNSSTTTSFLSAPLVMAPMPLDKYRTSEFLSTAGLIAPLVLVFAFLFSVSQLTKRLVEEKETKLREAMFVMGLSTGTFYGSWYLVYCVMNTFSTLIVALVLKLTMLPQADFGVLAVLCILFGLSIVPFACMLSSLFSKARIAALVAPLLFFVVSIPSFTLGQDTDAETFLGLSLFSPTAFGIGTKLLFRYELTTGFSWSEMNNTADTVNMTSVFLLLVVDIALYTLLALYLDAVLPSESGTPRHPLFFLIDPIHYVRNTLCATEDGRVTPSKSNDARDPEGVYEYANSGLHAASGAARAPSVQLLGLRKTFPGFDDNPFVAVNDLSFEMYEDDITVLLGHNGAGKTTAINMMTGMLPISSGDCSIYGLSAAQRMDIIRQNVGFCPQHNILWPMLTVREHLAFYAEIKGLTGEARDASVKEMIAAVNLDSKADYMASLLSGGQKRKLCVAIAFVGGSKMVFLDEPTAGMDVFARHFTWGLLKRMSRGRTILLTTHFMDEADELGSQIAIMAAGRLKCMGSPAFLKSRLGVGYSLRLAHRLPTDEDDEASGASGPNPFLATFNRGEALSLIRQFVPDAEVVSENVHDTVLLLPQQYLSSFADLFQRIEANEAALGIKSFGVTATTLEEIFMRLEHDHDAPAAATGAGQQRPAYHTAVDGVNGIAATTTEQQSNSSAPDHDGHQAHERVWRTSAEQVSSFSRQFFALVSKRAKVAMRDRRSQCIQIAFPVICVAIAIGLSTIGFPDLPAMTMRPALYQGRLDVDVSGCGNNFTGYFVPASDYLGVRQLSSTGMIGDAFATSNTLLSTYNKRASNSDRVFAIACNDAFQRRNTTTFPATVLFTNESYRHAAPLAIAQYYEALFRSVSAASSVSGSIDRDSLVQSVANEPLPNAAFESAFFDAISIVAAAIFILIPFTVIPSIFIGNIVKERETKCKQLQQTAGMKLSAFWCANFVFDFASYLITVILVMAVFLIFDRKEYVDTVTSVFAVIILLIGFGLAAVSLAYAANFLFDEHTSAQNALLMANFLTGFLFVVAVWFLGNLEDLKSTADALRWVFRVFPPYCLGDGIFFTATRLLKSTDGTIANAFNIDVAGADMIFLFAQAIIGLVFTFVYDEGLCKRASAHTSSLTGEELAEIRQQEDADVAAERAAIDRIMTQAPAAASAQPSPLTAVGGGGAMDGPAASALGDRAVVVHRLRKQFPGRQGHAGHVAVKDLTFGIHRGEVFGFLGTNGAGKTTGISIMCGEQPATSGDVFIEGQSVASNVHAVRRVVGYCPQFDALSDLMTVREHLYFYSGLRGLPEDEMDSIVESLIVSCDLVDHQHKLPTQMSGGNRRKLSVAIALVGGPKVLFLDEPSAGMDPKARRDLWVTLSRIAGHCTIVLTTHHLEEVEALASRVSIMVDGEMRCLGSLQHLKSTYGSGYGLSIALTSPDDADAVAQYVTSVIPQAERVASAHAQSKLEFALPQSAVVSATFAAMERASHPGSAIAAAMSGYALSQSTLESVFLRVGDGSTRALQDD